MIQDNGSNYQFYNHTEKAKVQKSVFDLSSLNTLTIPNGGQIIPLKWFETLPGDKWDLNFQAILRVMPQMVPLFSRQRMFVHAYWSRMSELWTDAETYMTKGYTGREELKKPVIGSNNFDSTLWNNGNGTVQPESLADYLDLPIGAKYSELEKSGVTCLPFMMYERIYQEYYMNRNFYTENRQWLPNDDGELRVNTAGQIVSVVNNPNIPEGQEAISFGRIHYRDWTQDYFTSALPWPQRGEAKTISTTSTGDQPVIIKWAETTPEGQVIHTERAGIGAYNYDNPNNFTGANVYKNGNKYYFTGMYNAAYATSQIALGDIEGDQQNTATRLGAVNAGLYTDNTTLGIRINANDIRELFLNQQELETMARTDGSYSQYGLAFFGEISKAARTYKPQYIGGTYQNITFGEVMQNAPQAMEGGSDLGSFAGRGGMATQGDLGTIYCDDYGYIMIVASIVPDTYYSQGVERKWTRQTQEDEFLPERAKLGMQAIKNEELVFTNGEQEQNANGWAWQNRFDELRYESNKIHGKIADPTNESFYPYTQARHFNSLPGYSQEFAIMNDVRKDYLTSAVESAYIMQCSIGARAVRPLPYKAVPAELI